MNTTIDLKSALLDSAKAEFMGKFGSNNPSCAISPATFLLLGDHTHYNDGIALSTSVNRYHAAVIKKREDNIINVRSDYLAKDFSFDLNKDEIEKDLFCPLRISLEYLKREKIINSGFDCVINSNVNYSFGQGLVASFVIAFFKAIEKEFHLGIGDKIVELAGKVEEDYFQKVSNNVHHLTNYYGKKNSILFFDVRRKIRQEFDIVSGDYRMILCITDINSSDPKKLCEEKIRECEVGVNGLKLYIWGIKKLRDVTLDFLQKHVHMLPGRVYKRCMYNVMERIRVEKAVESLQSGNVEKFGKLLIESHQSLREDYEIGSDQLDYLVYEASKLKGVVGAKGLSFSFNEGIFVVVRKEEADKVSSDLKQKYYEKYKKNLDTEIIEPADGTALENRE